MSNNKTIFANNNLFAYVHGFGSTPYGKKGKWMEKYVEKNFGEKIQFLNWHVPSFAHTTTSNSLTNLKETLILGIKKKGENSKWNIVASSYGAFLIATLSEQHPQLFNKIILLAPAFNHLLSIEKRAKDCGWSEGNQTASKDFLENRADSSGYLKYDFFTDLIQNFNSKEKQNPKLKNETVIVAAIADTSVLIEKVDKYYEENKDFGFIKRYIKLPPRDSLGRDLDHRLENFASEDSVTNPTFENLIKTFFN